MKIIPLHGELSAMTETVLQAHRGYYPACGRRYGVIPFVDTILNNEYAPSNLKTAIDALAEKLTTEENAAVKKRALTSGSYDGENTDCVAGGQVDNAVFWPLSAKRLLL